MRDLSAIVGLYHERLRAQQPELAAMRRFEDFINDKIPVSLAELDRSEQSAIANLAAQGLTGMAQRIGSVMPTAFWPPLRIGIKASEEKARTRHLANMGWWEQNDMQALLTLRAEYLLGHTIAPVTVLPDPKTGIPTWRVREPLHTFPAPTSNPLQIVPDDCIFAYQQPLGYLLRLYGPIVGDMRRSSDAGADHKLTVLEYLDHEQIATIVLADNPDGYGMVGANRAVMVAPPIPNRTGRPLVFLPQLFGLGGRRSKFAGQQGTHQMRAKILALAYITASKGANPDLWLESSDPNNEPELIATPDPRDGSPGIVAGGTIRPIVVQPSTSSMQMLSILEREMRLAGGIPAAFGGEANSTVQTGRLSSNLTGAAVDYVVQQVHQRFERSLTLENEAAVAIVKKWTQGSRSFYVGWKGADRQVDYTDADFETDRNRVMYPLAGSDLNNDLLRIQQKVSTEMWSVQTALEMDPETRDPEREHDRLVAEKIEKALLASILQQAAMPDGPYQPADLARLMMLVGSDKMELAAAVTAVHQEAQARQAAQVQPGAPEAQPGLAQPGMGAESGVQIPPGPPSLDNLASTLRSLGRHAPQAA